MNLKHIVALSLAGIAASASAQSSVTLFGIVDVNTRYVNNSNLPSNLTMNNSGLSSGRFGFRGVEDLGDRKSTRLNSSHQIISYAVFCLKKKNTINVLHHTASLAPYLSASS